MMSRSIGENYKKIILFFSNYLPLQIWTLKICIYDISKTITARMMRKLIGENKKKSYFIFFILSPFADLDFEVLFE